MGINRSIQNFLDREHFTQDEFCRRLGCSRDDVICEINPQIATAVQNAFGISVEEKKISASRWTAAQIMWAKKFPIRALQRQGFIPMVGSGKNADEQLVCSVLRFMAVGGEEGFENYYATTLGTVNPQAYAAWIRIGELCVKRGTGEFSIDLNLLLNNLKYLCRNTLFQNQNLRKTAREILDNSGIALIEVKPFLMVPSPICASYWVGTRPVIQIPTTPMTDAGFLEAMFHAVGHIVHHPLRTMCLQVPQIAIAQNDVSLKNLNSSNFETEISVRECEAANFAENLLLDEAQECELICCGHYAEKKCIQHFSGKFHVRPGILVNRLQRLNKVSPRTVLNEFKKVV